MIEKQKITKTHFRTCNLCEAMCGIAVMLEGDRILSIKGDPDDPFSKGHICPKAIALQDVYDDPDRLRSPVRRSSAGWEKIGWEQAFDEAASNITAIQKRHGENAVGLYLGNPNVHNLGSQLFVSELARALRTRNRFSATSADQLPHHFAAYFMFGHQLLLPIPDIDRTDFFLIMGANPMVSNGSLMTAAGIDRKLKTIRQRGGRVIVIDPRRNETAAKADAHYFIRPGADVLLLLAIVQTILAENRARPGRLAEFTDGLEELWDAVSDFTPSRVSERTGIDAEEIKRLALEFAAAPTAVCYGRIGLSTQQFGGLCQWLINVLNLITGNLDRAGGAMFTTPAVDIVDRAKAGHFARWTSRVRKLPEFAGELPISTLADEIAAPGDGQIRAMVTVAGNPVLSAPNGRQLDEAFSSLEYMVAIDIYINETTRHAKIILPPTTGLETDHYDAVFHLLAVRNTAKYSLPLFEPSEDARHDWQIYRELIRRMATEERPFDDRNPLNLMTPAAAIDFALRSGPYGGDALSLKALLAAPHGIDLGPLQPRLPERLFTADKRIKLLPEIMVSDLERVKQEFFRDSVKSNGFDLLLIGRRQLRSNNSWMHNSQRLVKGKERCTLLMHPEDAAARGLFDGQTVTIVSRVGKIALPLSISDEIMQGVVSIPHGWGHDLPDVQLKIASENAGASINDLTDNLLLDKLTGNAAFSGVSVSVIGQ